LQLFLDFSTAIVYYYGIFVGSFCAFSQNSQYRKEINMSVNTVNSYGKISVTDDAVALIVAHSALDVYGVVDLVTNKFSDSLRELFKKSYKPKGIKITTISDRIIIDLDIILKYGVSINAVVESVRRLVKYNVEQFTGMLVDSVNINVVGVKV
jgi:uncharacterized alkaline shock family protein YloU